MRGRDAVVLVLVLVAIAARPTAASPLRERIAELACGDGPARQRALAALENAPRGVLGLPDESLSQPATEIDADVIDRLLEVLSEVRHRDPALAPRIDALVASWNYCAITAEEHAWNLQMDGPMVQRTQQTVPSTTAGRGFTAWGLIPRRAGGRPMTPEAGEPEDTCGVALQSALPWGSLATPHIMTGSDQTCESPQRSAPTQELSETHVERVLRPVVPLPSQRLPLALRAPIGEVTPSSGIATVHVMGVSGSVFLRQSFTGKLDSGLQLSWAPRANTFARIGAGWQLASELSPDAHLRPTWSLGVGYDDWHPGTWSFQINQWGPVVPDDRWKIVSTAAAELAYKVPLGDSLGEHFAFKLALSSKLTWDPSAAAALSFKFPHAVFASVGAATSLTMFGRPTWTYVIGRSTWMPGSLSIVLANFGPNVVPHPNFIAHGAVTASWGWAW